jgi:hypothetical protein
MAIRTTERGTQDAHHTVCIEADPMPLIALDGRISRDFHDLRIATC